MSVSFQVNNDIAEIIITGRCSQDGLDKGFIILARSDGISQDTHLLINVGESEIIPPLEAIEEIAFIIGTAKDRFSGRVSIFVAQEVRYGLARQLSVYLEAFGLISRPFYKLQTAIDWLRGTDQD